MTSDTHDCMWLGLGSSWLTYDNQGVEMLL